MKHKKPTLKAGQIAVDATVLDLVLTSTYAALDGVESLGRYVVQLLDAALAEKPNADAASLREAVAESLAQYRVLRPQLDQHAGVLRAHIAASRSHVARASERVM